MTKVDPGALALNAWKQQVLAGVHPERSMLRKYFPVEIREQQIDLEQRTVPFLISTASRDRYGDVIDASGWKLESYLQNPVVLWAHDYSSAPIARAIEVTADRKALRAVDKFATRDQYEFADTVFKLIVGGYIRATSVGFLPLKWEIEDEGEEDNFFAPVHFLEQELLEHSVVPVPANPEALIEAKAEGIDLLPVLEWAIRTLDEWEIHDGIVIPRKTVEETALLLSGQRRFTVQATTEDSASIAEIQKGTEPAVCAGCSLPMDAPVRCPSCDELVCANCAHLGHAQRNLNADSDSGPGAPLAEEGEIDLDAIQLEGGDTTSSLDEIEIDADIVRSVLREEIAAAMAAAAGKLPE
jgi:HK97 family phage prohead protease